MGQGVAGCSLLPSCLFNGTNVWIMSQHAISDEQQMDGKTKTPGKGRC
jgi:hypothetical protein